MKPRGKKLLGFAVSGTLAITGIAAGLPEGWTINIFAGPPNADYPTAISAASNGDVYISSDPNGSLGRDPAFGRIIRATDTNEGEGG